MGTCLLQCLTWLGHFGLLEIVCRQDGNAHVRKRSEEHTSELQSLRHLVCRLLLEKKKRRTLVEGRSNLQSRNSHSLRGMRPRAPGGAPHIFRTHWIYSTWNF